MIKSVIMPRFRTCSALFLLIAALVAGNADGVSLSGDPLADYCGLTTYSFSSSGHTLSGKVEYAVYKTASYGGMAPSGGNYIYAYQIFNNSSSTVSASFLTVALSSGITVYDIYSDTYLSSGGVKPLVESFSPNSTNPVSADYYFAPNLYGVIGAGQYSRLLVFSSDNSWATSTGTLSGGGVGGMMNLPAPAIPEPSTIALFGGLSFFAFLKRKRKGVLQ